MGLRAVELALGLLGPLGAVFELGLERRYLAFREHVSENDEAEELELPHLVIHQHYALLVCSELVRVAPPPLWIPAYAGMTVTVGVERSHEV